MNLKPTGRNRKKNWSGRTRAKILYFVSGRAGLGPKFQFLFRAGPGSGLNFNFPFGPGRAVLGRKFQFLCRAGPGPSRNFFLYFGPGPDWKIRPVQTSTLKIVLKKYKSFFFSRKELAREKEDSKNAYFFFFPFDNFYLYSIMS